MTDTASRLCDCLLTSQMTWPAILRVLLTIAANQPLPLLLLCGRYPWGLACRWLWDIQAHLWPADKTA
jgi:hypothetical protein